MGGRQNWERTPRPWPWPHSGSGARGAARCGSALPIHAGSQGCTSFQLAQHSQLSPPSKKKDARRRQPVLPGPSLYTGSGSESETYGLRFPGKTLSSSKANLAKGIGGGGGFSTSRALQRFPEMLHSSTHPPPFGGPQICPPQASGSGHSGCCDMF